MTIEGPILFMSNHQYPPRMWPVMVDINIKFMQTEFICDATFAFFLKLFRLETINVDTSKFMAKCTDAKAIARYRLISLLGKVTARNIDVYRNGSAIEHICSVLENGKNVFICPQTITSENAPWRTGVGVICKNTDINRLKAGFVYIPKPISKGSQVYFPSVTVGSLIPNNKYLGPEELVKQLEQQYIGIYGHL